MAIFLQDKDHGTPMLHRHLNHQRFTLAAIDDIITRGKRRDWAELRASALVDPELMEKIVRVCRPHVSDPFEQRYIFWMNYAKEKQADPQVGRRSVGRSTASADPA